ncbi:MAG: serine/threonine-protein kinase, partial [Vicinamibacterales bacterium]
MPLIPGARLGPYEILAPLGAGGMGEVYRGRDARLGREVAVKILPIEFRADPERLRRFEQEARAAAALNHPHILAVHDIGEHNGLHYIVSELLEGETLREHLSAPSPRRLPARRAVEYAIQIARGLSAAHDKGIVHRDLKPENIIVTPEGHVKILDFGLAKLAQPEPGPTMTGAHET